MTRHLCWIYLFFFSSALATVTAEIKPQSINLGDSFYLTLTVEGHSSHGMPSLIPLQHDFEIDSTEHRVSTTIMNGNMQTISQWNILLTPKKSGKLHIPPIDIGGEKSNTIDVDVTSSIGSKISEKKSKIQEKPKRIQLQTTVSEHNPYLHQQILYTIKLIHRDQLLDATYQPPNFEDALIVPLGESEQYQMSENNQTFFVEEQRYALFPQKTGKQTLNSPLFQALIYRGMPKRVRLKNDPIDLNIKSIPKTYPAKPWLPAKALSFTEQYNDMSTTVKAGTALIRTIRIEGQAIPSELLPTLAIKPEASYGVYPEKPISKNSIHNQDLVGIKTIQITYLLNQPGTIILPAYTITWFNTATKKQEISTLPARTIHIQGNLNKQPIQSQIIHQKETLPAPQMPLPHTQSSQIPWLIAVFFALMWVFTILGIFVYKKKPRILQKKTTILTQLKHACETNDPVRTHSILITWGQHQWPNVRILNLDDIKIRLHDGGLKQEISTLSEALYTKNKRIWKGEILWQCIKNYRAKTPQKKNKKSKLPPINPMN